MNEIIKTEEGDDLYVGDLSGQPFALLLRMTQSNGKPIPIGGFTGRAMSHMLHEVAGVVPKEVMRMNVQDIVIELEEDTSMMEVSRLIHGLFHWSRQSVSVGRLVAKMI